MAIGNWQLAIDSRRQLVIAVLIFLAVTTAVAVTARDSGLTWDEGIYFGSGVRYLEWFQNLSGDSFGEQAIGQTWFQPDHPPLAKVWIAFSFALFQDAFGPIAGVRVGAGILFGLAAAAIFLYLSGRGRAREGIIAALIFVLMPRVFAHGHFANIEMLTLLLWMLTIVAFEKGIERKGWSVACGVLFGLALLTKINGAFLPIVLVPWGILFHGRKAIRNIIFMAVLGPVIFFGLWPVMWHHPILATKGYLANKLTRTVVETYYLGTTYAGTHPPFHYPLVMLLATTPLPILVATAWGVWRAVQRLRAKGRAAAHEALLLWCFAFPILLLSVPGVPKYDGIRLMLPAYPFLAVLAASGVVAVWESMRSHFQQKPRRAAVGFAIIACAWLLAPVLMFHPFQLCYYGELVGGPWGAHKLGFETTYWHETFEREALEYLNRNVPLHGSVALVGVEYRVWRIYQDLPVPEVRPDLRHTDFSSSEWDYLVVVMRQGKLDENMRKFMAEHEPVWTRALPPFGTPPLCRIYAAD